MMKLGSIDHWDLGSLGLRGHFGYRITGNVLHRGLGVTGVDESLGSWVSSVCVPRFTAVEGSLGLWDQFDHLGCEVTKSLWLRVTEVPGSWGLRCQ